MATLSVFFIAALAATTPEDIGRLPAPSVAQPVPSPPLSLLDTVEQQIRMPNGAEALSKYRRYYAVARGSATNPRLIVGVFMRGEPTGKQWVAHQDLPSFFDGGCGVVTVSYSVPEDEVISIRCNGYA